MSFKGFYTAVTFANRPLDPDFAMDVLRKVFETMRERGGVFNLGQKVRKGSFTYDTLLKLKAAPTEQNWKKVKNVLDKYELRKDIQNLTIPTPAQIVRRRMRDTSPQPQPPLPIEPPQVPPPPSTPQPSPPVDYDDDGNMDVAPSSLAAPVPSPAENRNHFDIDADDDMEAAASSTAVASTPPKSPLHIEKKMYRKWIDLYDEWLNNPQNDVRKGIEKAGLSMDNVVRMRQNFQDELMRTILEERELLEMGAELERRLWTQN